jgi:hypothetical protein
MMLREMALRERLVRALAVVGLLFTTLGGVMFIYRTWSLTTGAALDWRLRVLLPDSISTLLLATGFALAAFGTRRLRHIGWLGVLVVILGSILLTAYVIFG